jgi:homoserine dehydrogenase
LSASATPPIRGFNLCFLGYGNVNRTLVRLLADRAAELRERYGIEWRITGIASRRIGWIAKADGIDFASDVLPGAGSKTSTVREWLRATKADVLFEATSLNVTDGQPAIDHLRAALELGAHAITANKGPIVFAHDELRQLARQQGKRFLFESTVLDGVPIFSLFREALPAIHLKSIRGILNSTTNVILTGIEQGLAFAQSLRKAQEIGIAETDASADIEGWDAAVKITALVNVLMGVRLRPADVQRQGIQDLSLEEVRAARAAGHPYKLVCRARRTSTGVDASVRPEQVPLTDPLALVSGSSSIIQFETDIFPNLTITEENPGLYATAYGMLADFVRAVS